MLGSFFKPFSYFIMMIMIFVLFICCFFVPHYVQGEVISQVTPEDIIISNLGFAWPIPGYTTITSYFGKRKSPTLGATSAHKGIDIAAPEGSVLIAAIDGQISYVGFLGGGGYTITLSKDNMKITYCHVSPQYMVKVGDLVTRGQVIGQVGPKYVYGVKGNIYYDETGKPTNGATTGCHLHFGIRVDENYVNPLDYYQQE